MAFARGLGKVGIFQEIFVKFVVLKLVTLMTYDRLTEGAFMTIYIYRAPRATSSHFISPSVDLPHSQSQFKDENVKEKQQHIHSMILW